MFDFRSCDVYFRHSFVPFKDAVVSIVNTAFLYGLGVFTGMRAHWNQSCEQLYLFRVKDHYKRLLKSCSFCQFEEFVREYPYDRFCSLLIELLRRNTIREDVYIRVTQFVDELSLEPRFGRYTSSLCMFLFPLGNYVPIDGMKCCVSSWRRVSDTALPARAKLVGAYVNTALAKSEAVRSGYDEAIVLDEVGHAVEGSAENLFIVRDGVIITPSVTDNILEGITRHTIMVITRDLGFSVVERSIDRTELYFADEVFLTGTGAQVCPVIMIDGYFVGDGKVGPVSQALQEAYFRVVRGDDSFYGDWLTPVY